MTTYRDGGNILFECDSCLDNYTYSEKHNTFDEAWDDLRRQGWYFLPSSREHECPDCRRSRLASLSKQLSGDS